VVFRLLYTDWAGRAASRIWQNRRRAGFYVLLSKIGYGLILPKRRKRRIIIASDAGWSSLAARRAHNPKVTGSNPVPATRIEKPPVSKETGGFVVLRPVFICVRQVARFSMWLKFAAASRDVGDPARSNRWLPRLRLAIATGAVKP
jgi:hypothetical protein